MQSEIFSQTKFYNNIERIKGKIKQDCSDFVVQEVFEDEICSDKPKVNIGALLMTDKFLNFLEENNNLVLEGLEERKEELEMHFNKMSFILKREESVFDDENAFIVDYLNKLTYKEYFFICENKEFRKIIHSRLKENPFFFSYSEENEAKEKYFRIKTCLIQNYSFILKKINKDTSDAKNLLEKHLTVNIDAVKKEGSLFTNELLNNYELLEDKKGNTHFKVSFCGNKDKKAITYQRMNVKCNFISLFSLELFNLEIMDIKRGNSVLNLGETKGNKFTISVKTKEKSEKKEIFYDKFYFLNYFGMQRFGKSKNNHLIGQLFYEQKMEEGLDMILMTFFNSRDNKDTLINLFNEKRHEELLKMIPFSFFLERKIIQLMSKEKTNFIKKLPRESIMFYFHSYQSFLFNKEINLLLEGNKIQKYNNSFIPSEETEIKNTFLELKGLNHKYAKGGFRSVLASANDLSVTYKEEEVIFKFILDKGCYATMLLREFIDLEE